MKQTLIYIMLIFSTLLFSQNESKPIFSTNYDSALVLSKTTGKPLMIFFSGTDWCRLCIKMDKNVFETPQFSEYAKDNLVVYCAAFPSRTKLTKEVVATNEMLAEKYNSKGLFPKVVVLDSLSNIKFECGFQDCSADEYISLLKSKIE